MSSFLLFCIGLFVGGTLAILYFSLCQISTFSEMPVICARWVYDFKKRAYECSHCNKTSDYDYNFCPNCGTEMLRKSEFE